MWLGNLRGNKYSRDNKLVDPYWSKYWSFNLSELAADLSENIEFVRKQADSDKIAFVGHGHSASLLFMNMYEHGHKIEDRISSCIALAPIAHTDYTNNEFYDFYSRYWRSFKRSV